MGLGHVFEGGVRGGVEPPEVIFGLVVVLLDVVDGDVELVNGGLVLVEEQFLIAADLLPVECLLGLVVERQEHGLNQGGSTERGSIIRD